MKPHYWTLFAFTLIAGCAGFRPGPAEEPRYIPVELWAGAQWDGTERTALSEVDVFSGNGDKRRISGPTAWRHPFTGESLMVYERVNEKQDGPKRQLFTLNDEGTGLGRVYDARAGSPERWFSNEAMFPVGLWRPGEERTFRYTEYLDTGPVERVAKIRIRNLDYTYRGIPHSLRYDWTLLDERGQTLFKERYVYSPGRSLVSFTDRTR